MNTRSLRSGPYPENAVPRHPLSPCGLTPSGLQGIEGLLLLLRYSGANDPKAATVTLEVWGGWHSERPRRRCWGRVRAGRWRHCNAPAVVDHPLCIPSTERPDPTRGLHYSIQIDFGAASAHRVFGGDSHHHDPRGVGLGESKRSRIFWGPPDSAPSAQPGLRLPDPRRTPQSSSRWRSCQSNSRCGSSRHRIGL